MEQTDNSLVAFAYTRKQAIEDGVLVDITDIAKRYGFVIPVAITANLLNQYVNPTEEVEQLGQSLNARLADVLTVFYFMARKGKYSNRVDFLMDPHDLEIVKINAHIVPRDEAEPVPTIQTRGGEP